MIHNIDNNNLFTLNPLYKEQYLDKGYVEYYDLSELLLDDNNIPYIAANIATLSYGNEYAKNPLSLYNKLKELKHDSVFEFIRYPYIDYNDNNTLKGYKITDSLRHKPLIDKQYRNPIVFKNTIFTFKIKIPLFVARQLMRHRCFAYLELSRRYVNHNKVNFEFYIPDYVNNQTKNIIEGFCNHAVNIYKYLYEEKKNKPEIARIILPLNLYTIIWMQGDIYCLENFLNLRLDKHAQYEINQLAIIIKNIIDKVKT